VLPEIKLRDKLCNFVILVLFKLPWRTTPMLQPTLCRTQIMHWIKLL